VLRPLVGIKALCLRLRASTSGEKEIRCLWFPNKKLDEGAEMTLDLVSQTAITAQDSYERTIKASPMKSLDAAQTAELARVA
jgi:hypothetical protein